LGAVVAAHRSNDDAPAPSLAYARVRLESALREAEATPSSLFQVWMRGLRDASRVRAAAIGVVVIAACTVALAAARSWNRSAAPVAMARVLPERSMTPGAVTHLTAGELCNGVRPSRLVPESVRQQVLHAYGMQAAPTATYEFDALITPELGGSTDAANLWPQSYHSTVWSAKVKDELERLLPEMVCNQQVTLAQAQREIASDWVAAYKRYFNTDVPLLAHLERADDEEAELLFVAAPPPAVQLASFDRDRR
jgi:hypothetical protein